MDITQKTEQKFNKLLREGKQILQGAGWNGHRYTRHPADENYQRFRTEALNLLKRVCGEDSEHYLQLRRLAEDKDSKTNSYYFKDCLGVVEAAFNDFQDDFLFDTRLLIRAELLDDFLGQAEYLLSEGYYMPAASLAGAILEDALRKLCDQKSVAYGDRTNINKFNAELAKAQAYNALTQKEITAKAEIRNNADHGKFKEVKKPDVEDMLKWIRRFVEEHLK